MGYILYGFLPDVFLAPFGDKWIKDKKLVLSCLRAFGFGPNTIGEENVLTHVDCLLEYILQHSGHEIDINSLLLQTNTNIILKIIFNRRYDLEDKFLKDFLQKWKDWSDIGSHELLVVDQLPRWLAKIFARKVIKRMEDTTEALRDFVRKEVDEHMKTLDKDNPRDFIDMYAVSKGKELDMDHLINNAFIWGDDAINTVSYVLQWIILYVTLHKDVQTKMQNELDNVGDQIQVYWRRGSGKCYMYTAMFLLNLDMI